MKQCPKCAHLYEDDGLRFCLDDGTSLVSKASSKRPPPTLRMNPPGSSNEAPTKELPGSNIPAPALQKQHVLPWFIAGAAMLLVVVMGVGIIVILIVSSKSKTPGVNSNIPNYKGSASPSSQPSILPKFIETLNVSGTTWAGTDSTGTHNEYTFSSNGLIGNNPASTWQQTGNTIVLDLNDRYAHYEGIIKGDRIEYQAHNKVNFSWTGTLTRIK